MNLNEFIGSGHPQNAPEYRKSNLPNSEFSGGVPPNPLSITVHHPQRSSQAATGLYMLREKESKVKKHECCCLQLRF